MYLDWCSIVWNIPEERTAAVLIVDGLPLLPLAALIAKL